VVIPLDATSGSHTLEGVGVSSQFRLATGISVLLGDALAFTGTSPNGAAALALALLLAGLGVTVARRRKRV
jgi:LPXTG-motif cell wall-anchored protein